MAELEDGSAVFGESKIYEGQKGARLPDKMGRARSVARSSTAGKPAGHREADMIISDRAAFIRA